MDSAHALKKTDMPMIFLALLNFTAGAMHVIFEFRLLEYDGYYRKFIQRRNILTGFVFLYFSFGILWMNKSQKQATVLFQIFWWVLFTVVVVSFWGSVTTLSMIKAWLPLSESLILLLTGLLGIFLSIKVLKSME